MKDESKVIGKAVQLKSAMLRRAEQIEQLATTTGKAKAGLAPDVKRDRLDTMEIQLSNFAIKQEHDGIALATLRWVLSLTEDIDATNLQLEL